MPTKHSTYLSHIPTTIQDAGLVAFVMLEEIVNSTQQNRSSTEQRIKRTLYHIGGRDEGEL